MGILSKPETIDPSRTDLDIKEVPGTRIKIHPYREAENILKDSRELLRSTCIRVDEPSTTEKIKNKIIGNTIEYAPHTFEIWYRNAELELLFHSYNRQQDTELKKDIQSTFPQTKIADIETKLPINTEKDIVAGGKINLERPPYWMIRRWKENTNRQKEDDFSEQFFNPLKYLTNRIIGDNTKNVWIQIAYRKEREDWAKKRFGLKGEETVDKLKEEINYRDIKYTAGILKKETPSKNWETRLAEIIHREKINTNLPFNVNIRYFVGGKDKETTTKKAELIGKEIRKRYQFESGLNKFQHKKLKGDNLKKEFLYALHRKIYDNKIILNLSELTGLVYLPNESIQTPEIDWSEGTGNKQPPTSTENIDKKQPIHNQTNQQQDLDTGNQQSTINNNTDPDTQQQSQHQQNQNQNQNQSQTETQQSTNQEKTTDTEKDVDTENQVQQQNQIQDHDTEDNVPDFLEENQNQQQDGVDLKGISLDLINKGKEVVETANRQDQDTEEDKDTSNKPEFIETGKNKRQVRKNKIKQLRKQRLDTETQIDPDFKMEEVDVEEKQRKIPDKPEYQKVGIESTSRSGDKYMGPYIRNQIHKSKQQKNSIYIGYTENAVHGIRETPITKDNWFKHGAIFGTTGMGKTTLAVNIMVQIAIMGYGFCCIDPKGDMVKNIIEKLPEYRKDDIVWVEPGSKQDKTIAINFLDVSHINREDKKEEEKEVNRYIEKIVDDFKDIIADEKHWGARMDRVFESMVRSMMKLNYKYREHQFHLEHLYQIILKKEKRKKFQKLAQEKLDENINSYTERIAEMDDEKIDALMGRIKSWIENDILRKIIAQPKTTLQIEKAIENNKIILVDNTINSDTIKRLISVALVRQIWSRIQDRQKEKAKEYKEILNPYFLFIDEFDKVLTQDMDIEDILSKARSGKLGLYFLMQHPNQLKNIGGNDGKKHYENLFSNINTIMSFGVRGNKDSETVAQLLDKQPKEIKDLSKYKMYTKITLDGKRTRPLKVNTFAPYPPIRTKQEIENIKNESLQKYGVEPNNITPNADWVMEGLKEQTATNKKIENDLLQKIWEATQKPHHPQNLEKIKTQHKNQTNQDIEPTETIDIETLQSKGYIEKHENPYNHQQQTQQTDIDIKQDQDSTPITIGKTDTKENIIVEITEKGKEKALKRKGELTQPIDISQQKLETQKEIVNYLLKLGFGINIKPTESRDDIIVECSVGVDFSSENLPQAEKTRQKFKQQHRAIQNLSEGMDMDLTFKTLNEVSPQTVLPPLEKTIENNKKCIYVVEDARKDNKKQRHYANQIANLLDTIQNPNQQTIYTKNQPLPVGEKGEAFIVTKTQPIWRLEKRQREDRRTQQLLVLYEKRQNNQQQDDELAEIGKIKKDEVDKASHSAFETWGRYDNREKEYIVYTKKDRIRYDTEKELKENWNIVPKPYLPEKEFSRPPKTTDYAVIIKPQKGTPLLYETKKRTPRVVLNEAFTDINSDKKHDLVLEATLNKFIETQNTLDISPIGGKNQPDAEIENINTGQKINVEITHTTIRNPAAILENHRNSVYQRRPTIFFTESIEHAEKLQETLENPTWKLQKDKIQQENIQQKNKQKGVIECLYKSPYRPLTIDIENEDGELIEWTAVRHRQPQEKGETGNRIKSVWIEENDGEILSLYSNNKLLLGIPKHNLTESNLMAYYRYDREKNQYIVKDRKTDKKHRYSSIDELRNDYIKIHRPILKEEIQKQGYGIAIVNIDKQQDKDDYENVEIKTYKMDPKNILQKYPTINKNQQTPQQSNTQTKQPKTQTQQSTTQTRQANTETKNQNQGSTKQNQHQKTETQDTQKTIQKPQEGSRGSQKQEKENTQRETNKPENKQTEKKEGEKQKKETKKEKGKEKDYSGQVGVEDVEDPEEALEYFIENYIEGIDNKQEKENREDQYIFFDDIHTRFIEICDKHDIDIGKYRNKRSFGGEFKPMIEEKYRVGRDRKRIDGSRKTVYYGIKLK